MSQQLVSHLPTPQGLLELFTEDCRDRQLTDETVRRYRSSIKQYIAYLNEHDASLLQVNKHVLRAYIHERRSSGLGQKTLENEEMSLLVNSVVDTRDKAIMILLAKTSVRRGELIAMDIEDFDWSEQSITLKRNTFKKRSGRTVFFDDETAGTTISMRHESVRMARLCIATGNRDHLGQILCSG